MCNTNIAHTGTTSDLSCLQYKNVEEQNASTDNVFISKSHECNSWFENL